jgi:hypothetical protein
MTPADAEEYTQALGQVMTVQQWVDDRLGGYVRLSLKERPEEMKEAVHELTKPVESGGEGLSTRQAAEVLGVSRETVRKAADNKLSPVPEAARGGELAADNKLSPVPEAAREAKSHAVAHEERKETARQKSASPRPPTGRSAPTSRANRWSWARSRRRSYTSMRCARSSTRSAAS